MKKLVASDMTLAYKKAARRAAHKSETQRSGFDFERRSDGVNER